MTIIDGFNRFESKAPPRWLDTITHVFFPERCLFCREVLSSSEGRPICRSCSNGFSPVGLICPACENIIIGKSSCLCQSSFSYLQSLFALSYYVGQWRFLLHNLKYYKCRSLARPLGRWLGLEIITRQFCQPDVIVSIPLHIFREKERGFNQSSLIASYTARTIGKRHLPLLNKTIDTISQTTLSRRERFENIRNVFSSNKILPQGTEVMLIDDIYSTGSTMKEAAKVLSSSGAKVHGAVIAYNPLIK